ncbi:MAG: hypothetical protein ACRC2Y_04320 [Aeromonas veronii]
MKEFKRNAKHEAEAAEQGLTIVGAGKNANNRIYRFNKCGHEQELAVCAVRRGNCRCSQCLHHKLEQEAAARGLELIGKGKNRQYRLYRFNKCGHERELAVCAVRSGECRCLQCQKQKLEQEAAEQELTTVGAGKNNHYRLYRCVKCGNEQEFAVSSVRAGNCMCSNCGTCSSGFDPTKAGSCYLYRWTHPETGHQFLKFGITNRKVEDRIKDQQRETAYKPSQIYNMAYPSGQVAKELEASLDALQKASGGHYMKKEVFGDGYTETISMKHEQKVMELISEYCFGLSSVL